MKTNEEVKMLAKMATRLFEHWNLSLDDQLRLLGLSSKSKRCIYQYRKGESAPSKHQSRERIFTLLEIHKQLKIRYPRNIEICYTWVHQSNALLNNETPLNIMKNDGLSGMKTIESFLIQINCR